MLALSIRQPYAEEILRGIKTVEYRRAATHIVGQEFYIYAAKTFPSPGELKRFCTLSWSKGQLPTGVLVGIASISHCTPAVEIAGYWCWHLVDVKRLVKPARPERQPQPVWFRPF